MPRPTMPRPMGNPSPTAVQLADVGAAVAAVTGEHADDVPWWQRSAAIAGQLPLIAEDMPLIVAAAGLDPAVWQVTHVSGITWGGPYLWAEHRLTGKVRLLAGRRLGRDVATFAYARALTGDTDPEARRGLAQLVAGMEAAGAHPQAIGWVHSAAEAARRDRVQVAGLPVEVDPTIPPNEVHVRGATTSRIILPGE